MGMEPLASAGHPLEFKDSASCKRWVEQLTLTNVQTNQAGLYSVVLTSQIGRAHV